MPTHIPVLLGSFFCGGPLGFAIGLFTPVIRYLFFDSGVSFSEIICLSFELGVCGCIGGYLYRAFPKKWLFYALNVAISLVSAKIAFFVLSYLLTIFFQGTELGIDTFISMRIASSLVGMAFQIIVIPTVVIIFQKAKITSGN